MHDPHALPGDSDATRSWVVPAIGSQSLESPVARSDLAGTGLNFL